MTDTKRRQIVTDVLAVIGWPMREADYQVISLLCPHECLPGALVEAAAEYAWEHLMGEPDRPTVEMIVGEYRKEHGRGEGDLDDRSDQTDPLPTRTGNRYRVAFHDYVYGRISFETTVESPGIVEAAQRARDGIVMPEYVIATAVTQIESGPEPESGPLPWSTFPPNDPPEPPVLRTPLSDPEIRALTMRRPEEVYGEFQPTGPTGDGDRDDPLTVDDILAAIANGDAGEARERIARCPDLVSLLTDDKPVEAGAANRTRDLVQIVSHLARLTGHTPHRIWDTLRSDARAVRDVGTVVDRIAGDPLLTPGQGCATLADGQDQTGETRPTESDTTTGDDEWPVQQL